MNAKVDAKRVLEFLFLALISYVLSPVYVFLSGWDLANNEIMRALGSNGLKTLSTIALLLLLTSLQKCRLLIYSDQRVGSELLAVILITILPIWVNLMYTASIIAGF